MDPALALPARRISDLLSSGLGARAKSKRETMDQPRVDPDQELVKRTQSGDAGAFDELVIKYTPRLYGLVYNMTSKPRDPRVPWQILLLYMDSFHCCKHDAQFSEETRPSFSTEPGRR